MRYRNWRFYVMPNLNIQTTEEVAGIQPGIERFENFEDAKKHFDMLKGKAYSNVVSDPDPAGEPTARLTLGIEKKSDNSHIDVVYVRQASNYLVDDFTRIEGLLDDEEVRNILVLVEQEIGFDRVKSHKTNAYGHVIPGEDMPFKEWNNAYLRQS